MDERWRNSVSATGFGPPDRPSAPPKAPSPLSGCRMHVVPFDDERLLIVSHDGGGGLYLEYLHRRGAKYQSFIAPHIAGAVVYVVAPVAEDIPRSIAPWSGPGIGLWEWIADQLPATACDTIKTESNCRVSSNDLKRLFTKLFAHAASGLVKIVARPLPLQFNAPFVELDPDLAPAWHLDPITEEATPRWGTSAGDYVAVRVLPAGAPKDNSGTKSSRQRAQHVKVPVKRVVEKMTELQSAAMKDQRWLTRDELIKAVMAPTNEDGLNCDRDTARAACRNVGHDVIARAGAPGRREKEDC
jgi:hypothetical protein